MSSNTEEEQRDLATRAHTLLAIILPMLDDAAPTGLLRDTPGVELTSYLSELLQHIQRLSMEVERQRERLAALEPADDGEQST